MLKRHQTFCLLVQHKTLETSNRWGYIYTTNLDVTGTIAGTFTGSMTSTLTGDVNNTNVTTVNANVTGPSNLTDVNIR